jgi:type III secretory pathway component EscR
MVLLGLPLLLLVAFVPSFIRMFSLVLAFALLFFARAAARVLDPLPLKIENQVEQNKLTSFFLSSLSDFLQALLYNLYNFLESNSVNLETKYHKLLQKRNKRNRITVQLETNLLHSLILSGSLYWLRQ